MMKMIQTYRQHALKYKDPEPFDAERCHAFLEKLAFPRLGGTAGEKKAADLIAAYWRKAGLKVKKESFPVVSYTQSKAELKIVSPYKASCEVSAVGRSGQTSPGGIEGEVVYVETPSLATLRPCKGKIVLLGQGLNWDNYRYAVEAGIKGFIMIGRSGVPPFQTAVRPQWQPKFGDVPGVCIRHEAASRMIHQGAKRVKLVIRQKRVNARSHNVIARVEGVLPGDERIIVGGHYDGVNNSPAACDNGGGAAIVIELARCYANARPARDLTFICFGSEEIGLEGSQAYVKKHKEELKDVRLMLNVDMAGQLAGRNGAYCNGPEELFGYVKCLGNEMGMGFAMNKNVYSSDNVPFNNEGVPSASFLRTGGDLRFGHTPGDAMEFISPAGLDVTGQFVHNFLQRCANAEIFPFDRKIADDVKKKVDEYVDRMKGPERYRDEEEDEDGKKPGKRRKRGKKKAARKKASGKSRRK